MSETLANGPLRETARGLLLDVKATPKAAHDAIAGLVPMADGRQALAVKVTAVPEKGKANGAIIKIIARSAGIPRSALSIASGETDRNKVFSIASHASTLRHWLLDIAKNQE